MPKEITRSSIKSSDSSNICIIQRNVQMAALEAGVEWLRPLANNKPWEYCVIWKLGDDPSSGGRRDVGVGIKIKDEDFVECKDTLIKHPIRSDACKTLAQLPSVIPLYSGIHGDVVISNIPRWTTQNANGSLSNDEPNGTRVLIPVTWGLIELFTTKHVPRDEKLIDFISAHFRAPLKQESMVDNMQTNYKEKWPSSLHYLKIPHQISQPTNYSNLEGSSTCSSISEELHLLQLTPDYRVLSGLAMEQYADSPSRNLRLRKKKCADLALTNGNEKGSIKVRQKSEKGPFKSKNLVTERNRRKRIKDGELALRALVPKITKMDRTATLMDAADYIKELLETVRNYKDELQALDEEDRNETNTKAAHSVLVRQCADKKGSEEKAPAVVEVEVNQLGKKDFLLKIICKQKCGSFSRLVQAINSLGLQVEDANVTTLHGLMSNVLKVEAVRADLDPNTLKRSLVRLVN